MSTTSGVHVPTTPMLFVFYVVDLFLLNEVQIVAPSHAELAWAVPHSGVHAAKHFN